MWGKIPTLESNGLGVKFLHPPKTGVRLVPAVQVTECLVDGRRDRMILASLSLPVGQRKHPSVGEDGPGQESAVRKGKCQELGWFRTAGAEWELQSLPFRLFVEGLFQSTLKEARPD